MEDNSLIHTVDGFLSYIKGCTQLYVLKESTPFFVVGAEEIPRYLYLKDNFSKVYPQAQAINKQYRHS